MTDGAFVRQRRCLNIISLLLIVYFVTGVELVYTSSVVSFRNEVVATSLVWVAFFYFWWRFHQFGSEHRSRWKLDFLFELCKDAKFRALYAQPEGEGENENTIWAPTLQGEGFRRQLSWQDAYLVGMKTENDQIQFADRSTFSDTISPATQRWNVGPETTVSLKWHRYAIPAFKANVAAMTNKSGTEWALPNFLACLALVLGISALVTKIN